MRRLTGIAFSPWSEKAKWALDHHHISYRYQEYVPLLGEFALRVQMGMPSGKLTVPVLRLGKSWLTDSLDIAKYAERNGDGTPLFPEEKRLEIEMWNARSQEALAAGRAIAVTDAARDPRNSAALVPPALRSILGGVAQKGIEAFIDKYNMREDAEKHAGIVIENLNRLSTTLSRGTGYVVGDSFTFADIAMALAVQLVHPVDSHYMPSGPPGVKWKQNDAMVARFAPLIAWRDALYAKHRRT